MKWCWLICISMMAWAEPPKVSILSPVCDTVSFAGNPYLLLAFSLEENLTYTWTTSDGQTIVGNNQLVTFEGTGLFEIELVATNSAGESSLTQSRWIYFTSATTFATAPTVNALHPSLSVAAPGQSVRIEADISDADQDGPYTYYWCWTQDEKVFRANTQVLETTFELLPGEMSRNYNVSLFVVDQAGNASFAKNTEIFISGENLPPSVRITNPSTGIFETQVGTTITFQAEASDPEGDLPLTYRWVMPDGTVTHEESPSYRFDDEGTFVVSLVVTDSRGNEAPLPLSVLINVSPAVNPDIPDTFIQLPSVSTRIFAGETLILSGIVGGSNAGLSGYWNIIDLATNQTVDVVQGNQPGRVKFANPGLYLITYRLTLFDIENKQTFHNTRLVAVHGRDGNDPPVLSYPDNRALIAVRNGNAFDVAVNGVDNDGQIREYLWMVDGEVLPNTGSSINLTANRGDEDFFRGLAYQVIRATALDNQGKPASQPLIFSVAVYKNIKPPEPIVNNLQSGAVVVAPYTDAYQLDTSIIDNIQLPVKFNWFIGYVDDLTNPIVNESTNGSLPPLNLERPGIVLISVTLESSDGSIASAFGHTHYLYALDADAPPVGTITKPKVENVVVEVGDTLTFEGQVSDPNIFVGPEDAFGFISRTSEMNWEVRRDGETILTRTQNEPFSITFEQQGDYLVSMTASNDLGLMAVQADSVTIKVVGQRADTSLEPNDTRAEAALLTVGNYGGLSVGAEDPIDWYRFDLEQAGAAIDFQLDLTQTLDAAEVFIFRGEELVSSNVLKAGERHPFTFVGSRAGSYFLQLKTTAETIAAKRSVPFGFSISVSNPRLVFSYPKTDEVDQTYLTLVNPTQATAGATLVARDRFGDALAEVDMPLKANGHEERTIDALFPTINPLDIAWVQVRSDQNILGLSTTLSRDNLSAVAEPALVGTLDELVIPHIAQNTGVWFTQASLVNQSGDAISAKFSSSAGDYPVPDFEDVHQRTLLDFEQFFGGTLPAGSEWGRLQEANAQPGLAGLEIFGTKNGSPRVAALNLGSDQLRNPNFTYVNKNLYFPHIAEDTANFFTGIAFVNLDEAPVDIELVGYARNGQVLQRIQRQLAGLEKVVDLSENLFPELPEGSKLAWLELRTNGPVEGYTIFGDNRGENSLLAGLTAIEGGAREVFFQKIFYEKDRYWTGLAVVNISSESSANLTYRAYGSDGQLLATASSQVAPHQKDLNLIENLFDESLVPQIRWVKLDSDQPVAAFELFGDLAGNFLAGCVAQ